MEHTFTIVVEPTDTGYSAYVIDLDGCITTGKTLVEVQENMREAISLHLEGMRAQGQAMPRAQSHVLVLAVA